MYIITQWQSDLWNGLFIQKVFIEKILWEASFCTHNVLMNENKGYFLHPSLQVGIEYKQFI